MIGASSSFRVLSVTMEEILKKDERRPRPMRSGGVYVVRSSRTVEPDFLERVPPPVGG